LASTYTSSDAITWVKNWLKNEPIDGVDGVKYGIPDDIIKMIWMAAPWRFSVGVLPVVTLASNTQDYTVALPSDWLYPIHGYVMGGTENVVKHMFPMPVLPQTYAPTGIPGRFAITGTASTNGTLRIYPKLGTLSSTAHYAVVYYKKTSPKIAAANYSTAGSLIIDDEWFWVFRDGVLWKSYLWADDPRAGTVQATPDGKIQYSGQRAVFEAGLFEMKAREPLFLLEDEKPMDIKAMRR